MLVEYKVSGLMLLRGCGQMRFTERTAAESAKKALGIIRKRLSGRCKYIGLRDVSVEPMRVRYVNEPVIV